MSFDPECLKLAEFFLADVKGATSKDALTLAQDIQDVCECACREIEERQAQ